MRQINCYIPIKLRITGRLSDAQLDRLVEGLMRTLVERIEFAERAIAIRHGEQLKGNFELLREGYNSAREDGAAEGYSVPSYNVQGQVRRIPVHRRAGDRRWRVQKVITIRLQVRKFVEYLESLDRRNPSVAEIRALYQERFDEVCPAAVWLVVANEMIGLETLVEEVAQHISEFVPAGKNFYYVHTYLEANRKRLLALDEEHKLAELPDMSYNPGYFTPEGRVVLKRGGMLLFVEMAFPMVSKGEIVVFGEELTVSLPLHAMAFIVNGESFKRLFGLSWDDHISEFGDQPASLRILPVFPLRRAHFQTLKYFVEANIAATIEKDSAYFGNLYLLNRNRLNWLPLSARTKARELTDDLTLALNESRREGWWEPDWVGAFIYAVISPTGDQLEQSQPKAERSGQKEPSETPEQLVNRFTNLGNLDEDGLGAYLVGLIRHSPTLSHYVQRVLDELGNTNRDDVSLALAENASETDLDSLAHSLSGRLLLERLYDELTSGSLGESEKKQAERILGARVRSRSVEVAERRLARSIRRGWIFPFRQPGPTVLDDAPIMAERLSDGRIRVKIPVRVAGTSAFRAETQTLPSQIFTSGLVLDADEWVTIKLYDEGGIIVQRPALYLLEVSNQSDTRTLESIGTLVVTVGTFGVGGGAVGAVTWGARVLLFLDRAAIAISIITIVVRDHRGWFIKTFGEAGRDFVEAVEVAGALAGIYGLGRVAFSLPKVISNLRKVWRNWRGSPPYRSLSGEDLRRAEQVSQQTEEFLNNADEAAAAMQREAATGSPETPRLEETQTPPPVSSVKPREPAPVEAAGKTSEPETLAPKETTAKSSRTVAVIERELQSKGIAPDDLRKFAGGKRISTAVAKRVEKLAEHFTPEDIKKLGEFFSKNKITLNDDLVDAFIRTVPRGKMGEYLSHLEIAQTHGEATKSPGLSAEEPALEEATTVHPGKPPRIREIVETPGSEALRASLVKHLGEEPPPGYHAHHIIPEKQFGEGLEWLRERLRRAGSNINEADNGVFLAGSKSTANPDLTRLHNSYVHAGSTKEYAYTLTRRLSGKHGAKFLEELRKIGDEMRTGRFKIDEIPYGWKGKWKPGMMAPIEPGGEPGLIEE